MMLETISEARWSATLGALLLSLAVPACGGQSRSERNAESGPFGGTGSLGPDPAEPGASGFGSAGSPSSGGSTGAGAGTGSGQTQAGGGETSGETPSAGAPGEGGAGGAVSADCRSATWSAGCPAGAECCERNLACSHDAGTVSCTAPASCAEAAQIQLVTVCDPFGGCAWPLHIDSVEDCGEDVALSFTVSEPCGSCDAVLPTCVQVEIAASAKPVRAVGTLARLPCE
jgi:hypothetical protein